MPPVRHSRRVTVRQSAAELEVGFDTFSPLSLAGRILVAIFWVFKTRFFILKVIFLSEKGRFLCVFPFRKFSVVI